MSGSAKKNEWIKAVLGFDVEAASGIRAGGHRAPPSPTFAAAAPDTGRARSGLQMGAQRGPVPPAFQAAAPAAGRAPSGIRIGTARGADPDAKPATSETTSPGDVSSPSADPATPDQFHAVDDATTPVQATAYLADDLQIGVADADPATPDQPHAVDDATTPVQATAYLADDLQIGVADADPATPDQSHAVDDPSAAEPAPAGSRRVFAKGPAKAHPTVDASSPTPTGLKGKRVGDEYAGEHNMSGWRSAKPENKQNTAIFTALNTEQQRADRTLELAEDGSYVKGDGTSVKGKVLGYAMDPATGEMVGFDDTARGKKDGATVVEGGIDRVAFARRQDPSIKMEIGHHSTALGGDVDTGEDGAAKLDRDGKPIMKSRAAASAGFVTFDALGQLVKISNSSGHYKPQVDYLIQAVEHLSRQGAFVTDALADADGNPIDPASDAGRLHEAVQPRLKQAAALMKEAQTLSAHLAQDDLPDTEAGAAGKRIKAIGDQITVLNKAVETLRKLGVAPSQKARRVEAEYLEIRNGMTGVEVRDGKTAPKTLEAGRFLRTGGGNVEQEANKQVVLDELNRKGPALRKAAEAGALASEGSGTKPEPADVSAALAALAAAMPGAPPAAPKKGQAGNVVPLGDLEDGGDGYKTYAVEEGAEAAPPAPAPDSAGDERERTLYEKYRPLV